MNASDWVILAEFFGTFLSGLLLAFLVAWSRGYKISCKKEKLSKRIKAIKILSVILSLIYISNGFLRSNDYVEFGNHYYSVCTNDGTIQKIYICNRIDGFSTAFFIVLGCLFYIGILKYRSRNDAELLQAQPDAHVGVQPISSLQTGVHAASAFTTGTGALRVWLILAFAVSATLIILSKDLITGKVVGIYPIFWGSLVGFALGLMALGWVSANIWSIWSRKTIEIETFRKRWALLQVLFGLPWAFLPSSSGLVSSVRADVAHAAYVRSEFEVLESMATAGNEYAQSKLSAYYDKVGDFEKSAYWSTQASAQNHLNSTASLAYAYYAGRGVPQDFQKAARLARIAAEQGNEFAQYLLGTFYIAGEGVPEDRNLAKNWFRKAAEQGNEAAQTELEAMQASE